MKLTRISNSKKAFNVDARADVEACVAGASVGGGVSLQDEYAELFYIDSTFSGVRQVEKLPESPWLNNEFQDFVQRCESNNRLLEEKVTFMFSESSGISADLQAKLKLYGIEVGGIIDASSSKKRSFACTYTVEF